MSVKTVTLFYGVCDICGEDDEYSCPTAEEAIARMWEGKDGQSKICWDCVEKGH